MEQVQESTRIDRGMLVSYDGENVGLAVPDTITKNTFKETQSPEEVTHITLNGNVEEISPMAFDCLPALRGVTVPKENKFFRSVTEESWDNTYLCGIDKPIVFCFPSDGSSVYLSGEADAPYFYGEGVGVDFVCNGAVFTLEAKKEGDDAIRWYCSSMRHGENMLAFEEAEEVQGGNYGVSILRSNSDDIVFQRKSGVRADAYILTASGNHVELHSRRVDEGGISFHLGERKELRYEKVADEHFDFEPYAVSPAGIDGNAIYSEEGVASVVDGKLALTADKKCTVSDYWNMRGTDK